MLNFIFEYKALFAILLFGLSATFLFFYQNFNTKKIKTPSLLRGSNTSSFVIMKNKKMINHDTMLLNMKLPGDDLTLGLNIG